MSEEMKKRAERPPYKLVKVRIENNGIISFKSHFKNDSSRRKIINFVSGSILKYVCAESSVTRWLHLFLKFAQ